MQTIETLDVRTAVEPAPPLNSLLRSLPRDDLDRLRPFLERVPLVPRRVLQHGGLPIEHIYFIEDGLVSVFANAEERNGVEVWLIGREGVVGSPAVLGRKVTPLRYVVQIGGDAFRISVEDLTQLMADMPSLRAALLDYLHTALVQSSQSAACGLKHAFPQRLARWLLTAQDRCTRDDLPITHELLARILGVRRATVSEAVNAFEQRGLLDRLRGLIRIRDRDGLEKSACRCYRVTRQESAPRNTRGKVFALPLFWALLEFELVAI